MRFLPSATSYPSLPVALLLGDLAAAEHYAEVLLDHSTRYELARWRAVGPDYRAVLVIMRGDLDRGLRLLRANGDEPGEADAAVLRLIAFLMAEALGRTGQIADGLPAVEKALASTERTGERWALASYCASRASCSRCRARLESR